MSTFVAEEHRQLETSATAEVSASGCACIVEVDRITEPEWAVRMSGFADANIYQTWSYGAVRWQEKNLSHLILKRADEVVAMAQLRILRPGNLRYGVAYLRWGPMCQRRGEALDPELVQAMASALRHEYVENRGLHLEILPNAFSGSERADIFHSAFSQFDSGPGIHAETYRTFVVDLGPRLEDLRKALDKKWRNQLNAAERAPLQVSEGGTENYLRFRALYDEMWQRKKFDTSVSVEEFDRIQQRLPEAQKMRVLICEHEGRPVSGLIVSAMGDSGIYLLGATNDEGMKVKASYRLQWNTVEWLQQCGIRYYDLGGIDPESNPGVYHFKSGFSGADVSHIAAFSACDNKISAVLVKAGRALRGGRRQKRSANAGRSPAKVAQ